MTFNALTSLSPLDGRYAGKVDALRAQFSEFGLKRIPQKTLNQRLDNYINTLMLNLKEP